MLSSQFSTGYWFFNHRLSSRGEIGCRLVFVHARIWPTSDSLGRAAIPRSFDTTRENANMCLKHSKVQLSLYRSALVLAWTKLDIPFIHRPRSLRSHARSHGRPKCDLDNEKRFVCQSASDVYAFSWTIEGRCWSQRIILCARHNKMKWMVERTQIMLGSQDSHR